MKVIRTLLLVNTLQPKALLEFITNVPYEGITIHQAWVLEQPTTTKKNFAVEFTATDESVAAEWMEEIRTKFKFSLTTLSLLSKRL